MDDIGLQKFCDCADAAGLDVADVRSRLLRIRGRLKDLEKAEKGPSFRHVRKAAVSTLADMSYGLERFAARSITALSGAGYILSAVVPRLPVLGGAVGGDLLGLAASVFRYFNPDADNTLVRTVDAIFNDLNRVVGDGYIMREWRDVRDSIVEDLFFLAGMEAASCTDAEVGVMCQVVPAYRTMHAIRLLEIRLADFLHAAPWCAEDVVALLAYVRLYCQLTAFRLVVLSRAFDVINHNPNFLNMAGAYLRAINEHIRSASATLAPLAETGNMMVLGTVGPTRWPDVYAFLPLIGIRYNMCADWLANDPAYPPRAVMAGKTAKGRETFIGRIETQSEVLIGQIKGTSFRWIGNVSESNLIRSSKRRQLFPADEDDDDDDDDDDEDDDDEDEEEENEEEEEEKGESSKKEPNKTPDSVKGGRRSKELSTVSSRSGRLSAVVEDSDRTKKQQSNKRSDRMKSGRRLKELSMVSKRSGRLSAVVEDSDRTEQEDTNGDEDTNDDDDSDSDDDSDGDSPAIPADVRVTSDTEDYRILCITDPKLKAIWRPNVTGVPEGVGALPAGRDTSGAPYFIGRMWVGEELVVSVVTGTCFLYEKNGNLNHEPDGTKYEVLCLESL